MGFLSFIKERQTQQPQEEQQSQQQKTETAKQMYSREAVEQAGGTKPVSLTPAQEASAKEAAGLFRQGTQATVEVTPAPTPTPGDGASNQQPMKQNMMGQDKEAPALTPTSAQAGRSVSEIGPPAATPDKPEPSGNNKGRTPEPPSWER